jgi:gliding motility-associated-like protein
MRKKNTYLASLFSLLLTMLAANTFAQVYSHDFSPAPAAIPYTAPPQVIDPNLSGSAWSTNVPDWEPLNGEGSSPSLAIEASVPTPIITLTFQVATDKQLQIDSFSFWQRRSGTGPQNWSMTINGITAGNGTVPGTAGAIGTTAVASPVAGLTGTVTVTLTLTGATSAAGTYRLDNFVLNGSITSTCAAPVIASLSPSSGPAGTIVTINGSGFNAGTTSVNFNGTSAAFTVVSDNVITATIPSSATIGNIEVTTNNCDGTGPAFTVLATNCTAFASGTELYISEVYDEQLGSGGVVEIYNPTNNTITFNGNYVIQRYGNIADATPTAGYIIPLTGSIAPGMTYLVAGTNPANCTITTPVSFPAGFNENDKLELLKNGVVIDVVNVPFSAPGYTLIRKPDAVAPSSVYNINDWNNSETEDCTTIGSHTALPSVPAPVIATQPQSQSVCENGTDTFTIAVDNAAGFTYQWKMLNAAGVWVNVTDNADYAGATTNTLTVSQVPAGFNGNQYYVQISSGSCTLISNAVNLTVLPLPAVADVTPTQPTCTTPTGSFVVNSPTGAGLTYSINGGAFQASTTFANLAPGPYTITVQNGDGCTSVTSTITINTVPNAPAVADVTPTQPTCTTPTGSFVVNSPTGAGLTYSINGGAFQSATTFANLAPGPYTITVQNGDGCTSVTSTITINTVPNAPAVADVTPTQPTCTTPTGTIVVNSPTGAGLTYSINGGAFQSSTTFANLAPGPYTITVQNGDGCTSVTSTITINATATPIQITTVQGCEDTMSGKKYILQALPLNGSFDINTADFEWRYNGMIVGSNETIFNVTDYASFNNIDPAQFPLEFTVTVTSGGCVESASFIVESTFCTIPKGVSPNNDTLNDNFNLIGLNVNKLSIFNRYGKEVYSKSNYRNEWRGQSDSDSELPTGTYYYVIERTTGSTESGWVYLNREN